LYFSCSSVATTAGTGSETTGIAIFDYVKLKAKTGIGNRALKPTLGLVDPLTLQYLPKKVTCYAGFDVLWWVYIHDPSTAVDLFDVYTGKQPAA